MHYKNLLLHNDWKVYKTGPLQF